MNGFTRITLLGCLFAGATALAGEWPGFRGPEGDGHARASNLPLEWGPDKNVAWKQKLPGKGWSSPVLRDGRLYLTTAVARDNENPPAVSLQVVSVDAAKGSILWKREIFRHDSDRTKRQHKKNSYASPTPILEGDRLYVHFGHLGTACLTTGGRLIWKNESIDYHPVHGTGGSPIVVGGILFFACDGGSNPFVVALDKKTGKLRWRKDRNIEVQKTFSFSTATAIEVDGGTQIVSPASGAVIAYDPGDGSEIWKVRYGEGYSVVPKPVYAHGLVYVCSGFNRAVLYAIDPTGKGDVTDSHVRWTQQRAVPLTPSVLVVGDHLFMVDDKGFASCLNAKTGEQYYQERLGGGCSASPVYADGRIYVQNEEGKAIVLKPGREFEVLATSELGEKTLASYAVANGAIFLRTEDHLYRLQNPVESGE